MCSNCGRTDKEPYFNLLPHMTLTQTPVKPRGSGKINDGWRRDHAMFLPVEFFQRTLPSPPHPGSRPATLKQFAFNIPSHS